MLRAFLLEAIRDRVSRAQREGRHPDSVLRREVQDFAAWLAVGTWADLAGLDGTSVDQRLGVVDSGGGERGESLAVDRAGAARLLGLSERQVSRLVASDALRHRREGRRLLVPRDAIDEYLRQEATP